MRHRLADLRRQNPAGSRFPVGSKRRSSPPLAESERHAFTGLPGGVNPHSGARHLPILRDCEGHHERRTPRSMLSTSFEEEVLVLEAA